MKRKKISLDFTSLLDIMMIILFFFIINFKSSVDSAQADAAKVQADAIKEKESYELKLEQLKEDKQKFEEEKEEWQKQADSELDKIREVDKNAAANAEALLNFQKGAVFKINLEEIETETKWKIKIYNGDDPNPISEISSDIFGNINSFDIKNELNNILDENRFKKDDVIICVFMYSENDKGTSRITDRGNLIEKIKSVSEDKYKNFYCADIKK